MSNKKFDNDLVIAELRKRYPKNGPDPKPSESMEHWGERYIEYVRKKYNLKEP